MITIVKKKLQLLPLFRNSPSYLWLGRCSYLQAWEVCLKWRSLHVLRACLRRIWLYRTLTAVAGFFGAFTYLLH